MVLPQIFHEMGPFVGKLIGGLFFLLVCFAALTSTVSLIEVPVAYLVDQKKMKRKNVVWLMAAIIFIVGMPSMMSQGMIPALNKLTFYRGEHFLSFMADMCDIGLTVGGCLMCIFISRQWGVDNMDKELAQGNEKYMASALRNYLHVVIRWVCPILLGIMSILVVIEKFIGLENVF
jgi:NSS family neurotransmitter:Na+ symporter